MGATLIPQSIKIGLSKSWTVTLPAELRERLASPSLVKGEGGWQTLMADLQGHVSGDSLELPEALIQRLIDKAVAYGAGGYQSVIRWILCLLLAQHGAAILGLTQPLKVKMQNAAKLQKGAA